MIKTNQIEDWVVTEKIPNHQKYKQIVDIAVQSLVKEDLKNLSTKGEFSSQYLLGGNLPFGDLIDIIINKIKYYTDIDVKINACWTVYGNKYGYHGIHKHNNGKDNKTCISVVYFLETPSKVDINLNGKIYLILKNKDGVNDAVELQPNSGDLYIFPSHVLHGTYPQSEGLRHTLNMDFELNETINNTK